MTPPFKHKSSRPRTVLEPTRQTQLIYNRIRYDQERNAVQPNVESQNLGPPTPTTTSMSRSNSGASIRSPGSNAESQPSATLDIPVPDPGKGKRPRGRRHGPLREDRKYRTAIIRALKLACEDCKKRKVACNCYDFSKLEEAYQASRRLGTERSLSINPLQLHSVANFESSSTSNDADPDITRNTLFGIGRDATTLMVPDDELSDINGSAQPPDARQEVRQLVSGFDVDEVRFGSGTSHTSIGQAYHPGLRLATPFELPPIPFPIGSKLPDFQDLWRCEFLNEGSNPSIFLNETCSWTGRFEDLDSHFKDKHHNFYDGHFWRQCTVCNFLTLGSDLPRQCDGETNCVGSGSWKRWYYGHMMVESTIASTPALTQYTESESNFSSYEYRGWDQKSAGGGGSSFLSSQSSFNGGGGGGRHYHSRSSCSDLDLSPSELALRIVMNSSSCCRVWLQLLCVMATSLMLTITALDPGELSKKANKLLHEAVPSTVPQFSAHLLLCSFCITWSVKQWFNWRNLNRDLPPPLLVSGIDGGAHLSIHDTSFRYAVDIETEVRDRI